MLIQRKAQAPLPASANSSALALLPVRSAPELLAVTDAVEEAGATGDASCRSMRSVGSGGAHFELALLRRECEELRKQLDQSTQREQGLSALSAQVRAQHALRQSRDNKVQQQQFSTTASVTQVTLLPDSAFLEPLLSEGADALCIEMLMTAFTFDDPRITECAVVAHGRGALRWP